ncbi:hypothetical protein ARHIZOSPH14_16550 [Agromyces rhizosphaerae]|uniref:Uncharacterized protein n=2 Tax=Agromyces rhizosphaerae TaxID=88374 RepID=A0A9W6D0V8_9MICO|nr:hypothetical protein ARHIZOSPH14_16550 [Agromyces rhizosphaerae]
MLALARRVRTPGDHETNRRRRIRAAVPVIWLGSKGERRMTTGIALVDARDGRRDRLDPGVDPTTAPAAGPEGRQLIIVAALASTFLIVLLVLLAAWQPVIATGAIIGIVAVFAAMLVVRTTVEQPGIRVRALTIMLALLIVGAVAAVAGIAVAEWLPA